jgi:hypothetical protein
MKDLTDMVLHLKNGIRPGIGLIHQHLEQMVGLKS